MPTVSVKLPEQTKKSLARVAATQGITPHALMVNAIKQPLANAREDQAFVAKARGKASDRPVARNLASHQRLAAVPRLVAGLWDALVADPGRSASRPVTYL